MDNAYSIKELINAISGDFEILGPMDRLVSTPSPLDNANAFSISFCNKKGENAGMTIRRSAAGVIICHSDLRGIGEDLGEKTLILVKNPRLAFIEILQNYFEAKIEPGTAPTAIINPKADIHPSVHIGEYSYVGESKIEEGSTIYDNVYIYDNTVIGKNVTIHTGTTVGVKDAFAYERDEEGRLKRFPHVGGVVIEDDVDIHAHVNIDRGTFGNTIIGKGSKINRFSHIGHNGVIGKHCLIGGRCFIAGSCKIGDYCELAFCSCVRNGTIIGKNVIVGMGSVVTRDIEHDSIAYGVPAKRIKKTRVGHGGNSLRLQYLL